MKVKYHTKKKKKTINHSTVHTLRTNYFLNIYNPLNNKKFINEKKNEKTNYPILDFLKVKHHTKRKRKQKDKYKSLHDPHSKK